MERNGEELSFYCRQSEITSPGEYAYLYEDLPANIPELCRVVQSLLIHAFWIQDVRNYGVTALALKSSGRNLNREINTRSVREKLGLLATMDARPLNEHREADRRVVGNCRDYSVLLVSMLRHQGVPARVRSGTARYLRPEEGILEDHFVCEFWNSAEGRWQRTDAQIDEVQRTVFGLAFDTADLPAGEFLDAGESLHELKTGRTTPEKMGIFEFRGWPYAQYKLVSDLACVSGTEVLAWERWGICERVASDELFREDQILLERISELLRELRASGDRFREARELFTSHPDLRIPADHVPQYHEFPFL
jgi:hypothetical protein